MKKFYLAVSAVLAVGPAWSSMVYSNGSPNIGGASAILSSQVFAESFTLSSAATIQGVEFDTQEFSSWDGTLDYFFFSNNGFDPNSSVLANGQGHDPLFSKTYIVNGGTTGPSYVTYDFNLIAPLSLNAGTYWLGLHLQNGFALNFSTPAWLGTTTPNAQLSANAPGGNFSSWGLDALQLTLGISNTPLVSTPEPASFILLGSALLALGCYGKRRRSSPE
jgi:hypothetical protein